MQHSGNNTDRYNRRAVPVPSAWVARHLCEIPQGGPVLDLACGSGRHLHLLRSQHYLSHGVDRDISAAVGLAGPTTTLQQYDLEAGPWPFAGNAFAGIIVTNYLHRPLFACIADSLQPGGVLIWETFASGNEQFGRPRSPEFLLRPGELRAVFGMLEELAFEEVTEGGSKPAVRQRIVARKPSL